MQMLMVGQNNFVKFASYSHCDSELKYATLIVLIIIIKRRRIAIVRLVISNKVLQFTHPF